MKQATAWLTIALFFSVTSFAPGAQAYTYVSTVPQSGGCPQPNRWNLSVSLPLDRQWSTSLPGTASPVIITVAPAGSSAQLDEMSNLSPIHFQFGPVSPAQHLTRSLIRDSKLPSRA